MGAAVIVALFAGTAHAQTPAPESKLSRAPRSTKMVNIASPWRYDAGACHTLQSLILRRAAISRCALGATVLPISLDGPIAFDSYWAAQRAKGSEAPDLCCADLCRA
jgi:hypothetical protein